MSREKLERHIKAMLLAHQIEKKIFSLLDENDFCAALGSKLDRYNRVRKVAFSGESLKTPGEMLDSWYETRAFEARL